MAHCQWSGWSSIENYCRCLSVPRFLKRDKRDYSHFESLERWRGIRIEWIYGLNSVDFHEFIEKFFVRHRHLSAGDRQNASGVIRKIVYTYAIGKVRAAIISPFRSRIRGCVPRVRVRGFTRDTRVLRPLLFFPLPALACITLARFCAHRTVHTPCPVKKKKEKKGKKRKKKIRVRTLLPFRF